MTLRLGFSPCPNDTFIFDALVHGKVDTEGLSFELFIEDVETLNQRAFRQELDITKLSFHALAQLMPHYALLDAGSALGNGVGPLLVAKVALAEKEIPQLRIAIPGANTTANLLLSLAFPNAQHRVEMVFSDIEGAVLSGRVDAGLLIHENRFTYQDKGLVKLIDLGEYWEEATEMPIPLGGIAVSRRLDEAVQKGVNRVLSRSVALALDQPEGTMPYVRQHAQEMDDTVMRQHIDLYVNDYTRSLGHRGQAAVQRLFDFAMARGVIPVQERAIFVGVG